MRQKDISEKLTEKPYEISLERKALSRIIHSLADAGVDIYNDTLLGAWYGR